MKPRNKQFILGCILILSLTIEWAVDALTHNGPWVDAMSIAIVFIYLINVSNKK